MPEGHVTVGIHDKFFKSSEKVYMESHSLAVLSDANAL